MELYNTYLVVSPHNIQKLKPIEHFELDLGQSLTAYENRLRGKNMGNEFLPNDDIIQSHYEHHGKIIQKMGNMGILKIYNNYEVDKDVVFICNEQLMDEYIIDDNIPLYENLNSMLVDFAGKYNLLNNKNKINEKEKNMVTKQINNSELLNNDSDDGVDTTIARPEVDNFALNRQKQRNSAEYERVKNIPLEEMSMEERIIFARGR